MKRIIALLSIFIVLLSACDMGEMNEQTSRSTVYDGVVQEKYFQKGNTSTGLGMGMNGELSIVTSSTSDEYIIFVDDNDYEVSKEVWFSLEKGDRIEYEKGFWGIKNIVIINDLDEVETVND